MERIEWEIFGVLEADDGQAGVMEEVEGVETVFLLQSRTRLQASISTLPPCMCISAWVCVCVCVVVQYSCKR